MGTIAYLLLFFICSIHGLGLEVLQPPSVQGNYSSSRLNVIPAAFDVAGQLIQVEPRRGCSDLTNSGSLNGNIAFVEEGGGCTIQQKAARIFAANASAMVMMKLDGSVGSGFHEGTSRDADVTFLPSIEISRWVGYEIQKELDDGTMVTVIVSTPPTNPWEDLVQGPVGICFQIFFLILSVGCILLASWRLKEFIGADGLEFSSYAQICLVLEAFSGLVRCIYMMEPLNFSSFFFNYQFGLFIRTLSYPISITINLLMPLYWRKVIDDVRKNRKKGKDKLPKMRRIRLFVYSMIASLWTIELVLVVSRATGTSAVESLTLLTTALYVCLAMVIASYYAGNGGYILYLLQTSRSPWRESSTRTVLWRVSFWSIFSAGGSGLFLIGALLFTLPSNWLSPGLTLFIWFIIWVGIEASSIFQILSFIPRVVRGAKREKDVEKELKPSEGKEKHGEDVDLEKSDEEDEDEEDEGGEESE